MDAKKVQRSSVAPHRQRRTSPSAALLEPFGCERIYIRVNVTGVLAARCVGRMRKEPGMAGLAAIVAEPTSSGAKVKTEGSSTNGGGGARNGFQTRGPGHNLPGKRGPPTSPPTTG